MRWRICKDFICWARLTFLTSLWGKAAVSFCDKTKLGGWGSIIKSIIWNEGNFLPMMEHQKKPPLHQGRMLLFARMILIFRCEILIWSSFLDAIPSRSSYLSQLLGNVFGLEIVALRACYPHLGILVLLFLLSIHNPPNSWLGEDYGQCWSVSVLPCHLSFFHTTLLSYPPHTCDQCHLKDFAKRSWKITETFF